MKNCFKTVLAAVAVLVSLGASAQDDPSKETVIINPFTHTSAVSQAACDNIRAAVCRVLPTAAVSTSSTH